MDYEQEKSTKDDECTGNGRKTVFIFLYFYKTTNDVMLHKVQLFLSTISSGLLPLINFSLTQDNFIPILIIYL